MYQLNDETETKIKNHKVDRIIKRFYSLESIDESRKKKLFSQRKQQQQYFTARKRTVRVKAFIDFDAIEKVEKQ